MKTYLTKFGIMILMLIGIFLLACSIEEPSNVLPIYVSVNNTIPASYFEFGGNDPINVSGLSGLLADDQHILDAEVAGALTNAEITTTTLNNAVGKGTWTASGTWILPPLTWGGNILLNAFRILDIDEYIFDIRTITGGGSLRLTDSGGGVTGQIINLFANSPSPALNDNIGFIQFEGKDAGGNTFYYGWENVKIADVTGGSANGKWEWTLYDNGSYNLAMYLASDGTLYVDGTYQTFDEHDDAIELKKAFSDGETSKLLNMGVLINTGTTDNITGKQDYMIDTQKLMSLLAGGVYQNRDKIDALEVRIAQLEKLLQVK